MESTSKNAEIRQAAVLIPLILGKAKASLGNLRTTSGTMALPLDSELLFMVRSQTVEAHKGQISFPGGSAEPSDASLAQTALREFSEELGVAGPLVEVVQELPDVPTFVTGFLIRPFVGILQSRPEIHADPHEVAGVFSAPLSYFLDPAHIVMETREYKGIHYKLRTFQYQKHHIWGATARILEIFTDKYLERAARFGA